MYHNRVIEKAVARILRKGKTKGTKFLLKDDVNEPSAACRSLVSPVVCHRIYRTVTRNDTYKMSYHNDPLSRRLSAVYYQVRRKIVEAEFVRDVLYGPRGEAGIENYRLHLGLLEEG